MAVDIEVPDLLELAGDVSSTDIEERGQLERATITEIYFEEGELIEEGEPFALVENGYGSYKIMGPASGLIIKIPLQVGDVVSHEAVLATINTDL